MFQVAAKDGKKEAKVNAEESCANWKLVGEIFWVMPTSFTWSQGIKDW